MGTLPRLAVFAVGLFAAFGAAFGLGRVVGPIGQDPAPAPHEHTTTSTPDPSGGMDHGAQP